MWCDNCCLLLPLRAGAMALAALMALYSIAGGIILFNYGEFLFFHYPEAQIYGGYAMAQGAMAIFIILTFAQRSYIFTRALFYKYPIIVFLGAVRAGSMAWGLQRYKDRIVWECQNGGRKWIDPNKPPKPSTSTRPTTVNTTMPSGFCSVGVDDLSSVFTVSLVIDFILMLYMFFLVWRYSTRLRHYSLGCDQYYP